jgi:hypothetical protein
LSSGDLGIMFEEPVRPDTDAGFLRGWAITGVMLFLPFLVFIIGLLLSVMLGAPSDAAFVGVVVWGYLLTPFFMVEPAALPGAWGLVTSIIYWAIVAVAVGSTTRHMTWQRAMLWAGATILSAGTLAYTTMRLLGHRVAFEGP